MGFRPAKFHEKPDAGFGPAAVFSKLSPEPFGRWGMLQLATRPAGRWYFDPVTAARRISFRRKRLPPGIVFAL
jgi:hypothetical protein